MEVYKSPLSLYVIWHPKFTDGEKYAQQIYSAFCRNSSEPLSQGLSIPVFFRSQACPGAMTPINIDFNEADRNAVIILIDENLVEDEDYCKYVRELNKEASATTRMFPISFTHYAFYIDEEGLSNQQFIKAHEIINSDSQAQFLARASEIKSRMLHDLCRLIIGVGPSYENITKEVNGIPAPINLFISHAKLDGLKMAVDFRNYVAGSTKLNNFFDANDIADGYEFASQIKDSIQDDNIALVVFLSDEYSNREWCRIEVLTAKRYKAPIVVVDAINKGERRSFPYLGNVPTIRWDNNPQDIIDLALLQVLKNKFSMLVLEKQTELYGLKDSYECVLLSSPPELFNFVDIERVKKTMDRPVLVLYPEPPLGVEELSLLNELDEKIIFTTPVLISKFLK